MPTSLKLALPINNPQPQNNNSPFVDIQNEKKAQNLFFVEFDLEKQLPDILGSETEQQCIRLIDQTLVESSLHFNINGRVHGERVFSNDLHYQLQGKKIIKSIQQRVIDYKEHLCEDFLKMGRNKHLATGVYDPSDKHSQRQVLYQLRKQNPNRIKDKLYVKMLNLSKSMGLQVQFDSMKNIEQFLTNFNQIVLKEGKINKFSFCFDMPNKEICEQARSAAVL